MDLKWKIECGKSLLIETWYDKCIIFNPKSGETHQLNQMAVDVLNCLKEQPVSQHELITQLQILYEEENNSVFEKQIKGLLSQFDTLGLIEPCI